MCRCLHPDWVGPLCPLVVGLTEFKDMDTEESLNPTPPQVTKFNPTQPVIEMEVEVRREQEGYEFEEMDLEVNPTQPEKPDEHGREAEVETVEPMTVETNQVEEYEFCRKVDSRCLKHKVELVYQKQRTKVWKQSRSGLFRNVYQMVRVKVCPVLMGISTLIITEPLGGNQNQLDGTSAPYNSRGRLKRKL
jgi:hypothetical protein